MNYNFNLYCLLKYLAINNSIRGIEMKYKQYDICKNSFLVNIDIKN